MAATKSRKKTKNTKSETFKISGANLLDKVKELIHEGNVRRIIIKDKKGTSLLEFPLTVGIIGTALIPIFVAIGTIAALVTECTITVERR